MRQCTAHTAGTAAACMSTACKAQESRRAHLAWGWLSRAVGGRGSHLPVTGAGSVWEHAGQRVDAGVQLQQQGCWRVGAVHAGKVFPGGSQRLEAGQIKGPGCHKLTRQSHG